MASIIFGIGAIGLLIGQSIMTRDPKERIKIEARNYFASHTPASRPDFSKIAIGKEDTGATIAQKLLENQKGLVVGEEHTDTASYAFLLEAMPKIKTLGLEYLEEFQQEFDDYISKKTDKIPPEWKKKREHAMFKLQDSEIDILKKARELGVKILCLDSTLSKRDLSKGYDQYVFDRVSTVNYGAIKKRTPYLDKGKFLIQVGVGHACTFDKPKVPGLGPMLGVPSLFIKDDESLPKETSFTVSKASIGTPTEDGGHPDVTILVSPINKTDKVE